MSRIIGSVSSVVFFKCKHVKQKMFLTQKPLELKIGIFFTNTNLQLYIYIYTVYLYIVYIYICVCVHHFSHHFFSIKPNSQEAFSGLKKGIKEISMAEPQAFLAEGPETPWIRGYLP